ncbi:4-hydroxy-3-methylbut-2-enyl diphosphate reductase [Candidatus Sumerlaeota bacterium]
MEIIRADKLGMCDGVRRAIAIAQEVTDPRQVTIWGQLVHNEAVQKMLARRGFVTTPQPAPSQLPATPRALITAHGIGATTKQRLRRAGIMLIDATCPLVCRIQQAARDLEREGRRVIVIGKPAHPEVRGIVEGLRDCDVVASPDQVRAYGARRLGVLCQSTLSPVLAEDVLEELRLRNPGADIKFVPTICPATRERQAALAALLPRVDAVVVVGGRNSNNTLELVRLAQSRRVPVQRVERAAELLPAWFFSCRRLGLTAGASTPDWQIDQVHRRLAALGARDSPGVNVVRRWA